jgi:hypothetical protein
MFLPWTVDATKCDLYHHAALFAANGHTVIQLSAYLFYLNTVELVWQHNKVYIRYNGIADMPLT